ncbi:hypothetical protein SPH9361_04800 [Sphingobium sp. CECT 9361]|nr:hypothetical protein SPH9361_04800 [Sphingobium sp. CECT 9361]
MTEQNTRAYYTQREQQERDLAAAATDPCAKAAHLEMAERYAHHISGNGQARNTSPTRDDHASVSTLAPSVSQQTRRPHLANG